MNKTVIAAGQICIDITPVFQNGHDYTRITDLLEPGNLIRVEQADIHTGDL